MTSGFLVVDKPGGMTSSQATGRVKRATGARKAGHAGTLDPSATGALVVGVGTATRLIRFIQDQPKEYVAKALFGVATDTLDSDGAVLSRTPMCFARTDLEAVLPRFTGVIDQVPPMFSALKRGGRRLHELAREGRVVEREARPVEVHELELLSVGDPPYPEVGLRVVCGKGAYIRSLADDIASALGGSAHLTALRRTRIGSMEAARGIAVDDLADWEGHLLAPAEALKGMAAVTVGPATARGVGHGMSFAGGDIAAAPAGLPYRVHDETGRMLAVYSRDGDRARPEVVLPA